MPPTDDMAATLLPPPAAPRPTPDRWSLAVVALVIIVIGAGFGATRLAHSLHASAAPAVFGLNPVRDGLADAQISAWSADGTTIALFGLSSGEATVASGTLVVYDVRTTRRRGDFRPVPAILRAYAARYPNDPAPGTTDRAQNYTTFELVNILVAPNDQRVAVNFMVVTAPPGQSPRDPHTTIRTTGVAVFNVDGGQPQILFTAPPRLPEMLEWDLNAGIPRTPSLPCLATAPCGALRLSWGADGAVAVTPETVPPGPIGWPDGGAAFALWQTADVVWYPPDKTTPGYYFYASEMFAWSPDGKYLLEVGTHPFYPQFDGAIALPGQALPKLPVFSAVFAPRDAALLNLMQQLNAPTTSNAGYIQWSPDGRLAFIIVAHPNLNTSTLTLEDTATAATLSLPVAISAAAPPRILSWSPDSRSVLVVTASGTLAVVPVGA